MSCLAEVFNHVAQGLTHILHGIHHSTVLELVKDHHGIRLGQIEIDHLTAVGTGHTLTHGTLNGGHIENLLILSGQLGILSLTNALNAAYEKELDLVLIAPTSEPPVCRIMDYGKYCFDRDKKKKEAKKKQQRVDVKEIQLKCQIEQNDFNTKVNNARRFLTSGDKVKVMVVFRGRQMAYQDVGRSLLEKFSEAVADLGTIDKAPVLEGRSMTMFISPMKQTAAKQ